MAYHRPKGKRDRDKKKMQRRRRKKKKKMEKKKSSCPFDSPSSMFLIVTLICAMALSTS
jgi:hypothetical protein